MKTKQLKLETSLFCTNFLLGGVLILSGIIDLFTNKSIVIEIIHLIILLLFLFLMIKSFKMPTEKFDELSRKIKNSVDSRILCISMPVIVIFCTIIKLLAKFGVSINLPWYSIIQIIVGSLFCLQYIGFVIKMKKMSDFDGEEDA